MATKRFKHVYQFKIQLKDIKPPIYRIIEVPEYYTFWDFHVAIQDAMGWSDYHLHTFFMKDPAFKTEVKLGIPLEDYDENLIPEFLVKISQFFTPSNKNAIYIYDFGDEWVHQITLREIHPAEKNKDYPICIEGKRACPPEDCGGVIGYLRMLEILQNPKDEEYKEMIKWVGKDYNPEFFDKEKVHFSDPEERFNQAFES